MPGSSAVERDTDRRRGIESEDLRRRRVRRRDAAAAVGHDEAVVDGIRDQALQRLDAAELLAVLLEQALGGGELDGEVLPERRDREERKHVGDVREEVMRGMHPGDAR